MSNRNNASYDNEIYHNYEWCFQKYITEGLNFAEIAIEAGATKRTIEKWVYEKHRLTGELRRKIKQFTKLQEDLIVGSVLGDGHITNKKYKPLFIVSHAADEKEYLYWKYEILKDFCNMTPSLVKSQEKIFNNIKYIAQDAYRINTRVHDAFIPFRDMEIIDLVDKLNEFSLSVWLLDDGSRSNHCWSLCVAAYSVKEREYIINVLQEKFLLDCKAEKKDKRYISFSANSSRVIDKVILQNIDNDLDVIKKKITENKINEEANYFWVNFKNEKVGLNNFCRSNKISYNKARTLYFEGIVDGNILIEKCGG